MPNYSTPISLTNNQSLLLEFFAKTFIHLAGVSVNLIVSFREAELIADTSRIPATL